MQFYFAPMEGVTGYIYRNAYHTYFNQIDKYFSPFIAANQSERLRTKEHKDVLPENNPGQRLIPQLLTNNSKDFIHTSKILAQMGYQELNLNLGCPSGTVVAKGKGSGFLARQEQLDRFLEEIFAAAVTRISVKTRIGKDSPDEFYKLINIYNKYPMEELIIHPRTQKDLYNNKPNREVFKEALRLSKNPVCYNGDIFTLDDYNSFTREFPEVDKVMLGRGLIANPGLVVEIKGNSRPTLSQLKEFHDKIYQGYREVTSGDRNVLFKMKEIWNYMLPSLSGNEKDAKRIRKTERLSDYEAVVSSLFAK